MAIQRPVTMVGPRRHGVQPMVKFCPACKGDLEILTSRREGQNPHNYWCTTCSRIFEINYLGRESQLDEAWLESVNPE